MITRSHIITTSLAVAGAGMWMVAGSALEDQGRFENDPNPLGLKRSPYGQVLAMAIQMPIDGDWHGALEIHDSPEGHDCGSEGCDHGHDSHAETDHGDCEHEGCEHDHGQHVAEHDDHGDHEGCDHSDCDHGSDNHKADLKERAPLLARLDRAVSKRTNPNPPSLAHKWYIRTEIEKKLRFAYALDPSHYANYAAYNLFITQQSLGTGNLSEEQVRQMVFQLAEHTIHYCLREGHDCRPALTAASAAYNCLERMLLAEPGTYSVAELKQQLQVIDLCLKRHFELLQANIEDGTWELLSSQRQDEVVTRSRFATKLREASETAIKRVESESRSTASNDTP